MTTPKHAPNPEVWAELTGHEESHIIVENVLTAIGPTLGTFLARVFTNANEKSRAEWEAALAERDASGKYLNNPRDARFLLRYIHHERRWNLVQEQIGLKADSLQASKKRFSAIYNPSKHGTVISNEDALTGITSLQKMMDAIGAKKEVAYIERPIQTLNAVDAKRRSWKRPRPRPVDKAVLTAGMHWVQPRKAVPGSWWVVAIQDGVVQTCEVEWSTEKATSFLVAGAAEGPTLAGLAFCFSAPKAYIDDHHDGQPDQLWASCDEFTNDDLEAWVEELGNPFFVPQEDAQAVTPDMDQSLFRETELDVLKRTGAMPSSIFQVGGHGSVGALAINGMPALQKLRSEHFMIWPFDSPKDGHGTCVEIFPRSLWARLNPSEAPNSKSNRRRREVFVESCEADRLAWASPAQRSAVIDDERGFDAFLTAWALGQYGRTLDELSDDATAAAEGKIWLP